MSNDEPSVGEHYDGLAPQWNAFTDGPWKKHVLWPTIESLLPDVNGARVLDAGCGDGTYSALLSERGADVVGIDISREMVRVARDEHGTRATFRRADLAEPLEFAEDDEFDLVLCQHVLSHVPDLESPLSAFARVMKPGGTLVVSTHNPVHDYLVVRDRTYPDTSEIDGVDANPVVTDVPDDPTYLETEPFEVSWAGPDSSNPGSYVRRPVSGLIQPVLDAGFELREITEPDPGNAPDETVSSLPSELIRRPPRSICFRAGLATDSCE